MSDESVITEVTTNEGAQDATETGTDTTILNQSGTETVGEDAGKEGEEAKGEGKEEGVEKKPVEEYDLKLPEGATDNYGALAEFVPLATELGLDNASAQKLVDHYTEKILPKINQSIQDSIAHQLDQKKAEWKTQVEKDPDLGGAKFKDTISLAGKAMDKYATPELKEIFDQTGIGNHPALIKFVVAIGRDMSEDTTVRGNEHQSKTFEDRINSFYPTMNK